MRLHVLSDLHLEFGPYEPEPTDADAVVLAGDIHMGRAGLEWIRRHFSRQPVVYVLGNHEFFRHSIPELTHTLKRETSGSHIHVLENEAVEIAGFTLLGSTLWTDFALYGNQEAAMSTAEMGMLDYTTIQIKSERRFFRPWRAAKLYAESVAWLEGELARRDPARTVVVTHNAPSRRSIDTPQVGRALSAAFASNLEKLIAASGIPLWIHGHTHYNVDYEVGKTRVYSNQRGYPTKILPGFRPTAVIEL
ncbi:MAG: metallophosphoesterase [Verrucomicrobiota bacterium]|jgi:Icc-related predicted phosphoesterase